MYAWLGTAAVPQQKVQPVVAFAAAFAARTLQELFVAYNIELKKLAAYKQVCNNNNIVACQMKSLGKNPGRHFVVSET